MAGASAVEYVVKNNESYPLSKRFEMKGKTRIDLNGKDINWVNGVNLIDPDTGFTPLMIAATQGKLEILKVLIERGADIDYQESNTLKHALIFGAKSGHFDIVKELLYRGSLVSITDRNERSALMYAAKGGHCDILSILIKSGAAVNGTDDKGYTALHFAAKFGHKNAVEMLINSHAAIEIRDTQEGYTAFHLAAQHGRIECVKLLRDFNCKINRRSTVDKFTAIMLASKEGHKAIVSYLITSGADCDLVDKHGWAALHFACSWGRKDTAHILIVEGKCNLNSCENSLDTGLGGVTPLIIACKGEQLECIQLLLNYGADINKPEMVEGKSPLCCSAALGLTGVIQVLLNYNVNINIQNHTNGMTAVMYAAQGGHHSSIILLLNYYADVNILSYTNTTVLEYAANKDNRDAFLSAIVHITPLAKVNLLPWVELECPFMIPNSMCGSPCNYLNSILYTSNGLYYGLLNLSADCDVYLVYCLVMLITTAKRGGDNCPSDSANLQIKINECEAMLRIILTSKALCNDYCFYDVFVLGSSSTSELFGCDSSYTYGGTTIAAPGTADNNSKTTSKLHNHNNNNIHNYNSSNISKTNSTKDRTTDRNTNIFIFNYAFFHGPLALYIENNLTTMLIIPQIESKIDATFMSCMLVDESRNSNKASGIGGGTIKAETQRDQNKNINDDKNNNKTTENDKFGIHSILLRLRYIPAVMFCLEGVGKLFTLIVVILYCADYTKHNTYINNNNINSNGGNDTNPYSSVGIIATLSFILYEIGLVIEKRWYSSPSIVYSFKELEYKRIKHIFTHFIENSWKFLDLLCFTFYIIWLVCNVFGISSNSNKFDQQLLLVSIVPLAVGLLRYPAMFHKPLGLTIRIVFLITVDLFNYLLIYVLSMGAFSIVLYNIYRHNNIDVSAFDSPYTTSITMFNSVLSNYDASAIYDTTSSSSSNTTTSDTSYSVGIIVYILMLVWSIVILFNSIIAHMVGNYAKYHDTAHRFNTLDKAKCIQQFSLVYEKHSLCMLPIPLNLITSSTSIFHDYYLWRARLYSPRVKVISLSGTISDYLLTIIFILPTVLLCTLHSSGEYYYHYLPTTIQNLYFVSGHKSNTNVNNAIVVEFSTIALVTTPFYWLFTYLYYALLIILKPKQVLCLVKSRVTDGRLFLSYGAKRDAFFTNNSLSNFNDERIYKNIEKYNYMQLQERIRQYNNKKKYSIFPTNKENNDNIDINYNDETKYDGDAVATNANKYALIDSKPAEKQQKNHVNFVNRLFIAPLTDSAETKLIKKSQLYNNNNYMSGHSGVSHNISGNYIRSGAVLHNNANNSNINSSTTPSGGGQTGHSSGVKSSAFLQLANITNIDEIRSGLSFQQQYATQNRNKSLQMQQDFAQMNRNIYKIKQNLEQNLPIELESSVVNQPLTLRNSNKNYYNYDKTDENQHQLVLHNDSSRNNNNNNNNNNSNKNNKNSSKIQHNIQYTPSGYISDYQPGYTKTSDIYNITSAKDTAALPLRNLHPGPEESIDNNQHPNFNSQHMDNINNSNNNNNNNSNVNEDLNMLTNPSIYFVPNKFPSLFTDVERKNIFKVVLPDIFQDESTIIMKQNENTLYILLEKIEKLEEKNEFLLHKLSGSSGV